MVIYHGMKNVEETLKRGYPLVITNSLLLKMGNLTQLLKMTHRKFVDLASQSGDFP